MPSGFGRPQWKPGAVGRTRESRSMSTSAQVKLSRVSMKSECGCGGGAGGGSSWARSSAGVQTATMTKASRSMVLPGGSVGDVGCAARLDDPDVERRAVHGLERPDHARERLAHE